MSVSELLVEVISKQPEPEYAGGMTGADIEQIKAESDELTRLIESKRRAKNG